MLHPLVKLNYREPEKNVRKVSYSQFSLYAKCPKSWELAYVRGLREYIPTIHTTFGTAMHEVIQDWLTVMYTDSVKAAERKNLGQELEEKMATVYGEEKTKLGVHFSKESELKEFLDDGIEILNWIRKHRTDYFSSKSLELLGIELPIFHPSDVNDNVFIFGFIDLVMRDKETGKIIIIDIKTSTKGWNKYKKQDKIAASQLVLYKKYFNQQYGFHINDIEVKYFIVKRKLYEELPYAQKRVQQFVPASGRVTVNRINKQLDSWISSSFNPDGTYNTTRQYPAISGKRKGNCRFCVFSEREDLCPSAQRIEE